MRDPLRQIAGGFRSLFSEIHSWYLNLSMTKRVFFISIPAYILGTIADPWVRDIFGWFFDSSIVAAGNLSIFELIAGLLVLVVVLLLFQTLMLVLKINQLEATLLNKMEKGQSGSVPDGGKLVESNSDESSVSGGVSGGGAVIGAIAGGVIGSTVGFGGLLGGLALGAILGDELERQARREGSE